VKSAPNAPVSQELLERLWAQMQGRYGHRWASQMGDYPEGIASAEWSTQLAGLTVQQIREGIEADAFRGDDWPPSSTHFRAMCLGRTNDDDVPTSKRPGAAMYRPAAPRSRRIESDASRAAADREMAKLRKLLRVSA